MEGWANRRPHPVDRGITSVDTKNKIKLLLLMKAVLNMNLAMSF
jgi:hypothetical protein